MMNQPWKLVLLLIAIFIVGAAAGGFIALRYERHAPGRAHATPEQWGLGRLKKLSERLILTPEQEEKLRPIMKRSTEELGRVRASAFAEGKHVIERMEHEIADILTPEQKEKFEQMNREMREHMEKFLKDRPFGPHEGPRHERAGPGGEPPPPADKPADKPVGGT